MSGLEERKIFMAAGAYSVNTMLHRGYYESGIGPKARKAKKAKRRNQKQGRRASR